MRKRARQWLIALGVAMTVGGFGTRLLQQSGLPPFAFLDGERMIKVREEDDLTAWTYHLDGDLDELLRRVQPELAQHGFVGRQIDKKSAYFQRGGFTSNTTANEAVNFVRDNEGRLLVDVWMRPQPTLLQRFMAWIGL